MVKLGEALDTKSKAKLDKVEADIFKQDRQHAEDFINTCGIQSLFEVKK